MSRLAEGDRQLLAELARSTKNARVLRRALAILDLNEGETPERVARRYQVSRSTIYNWVERFYGSAGFSGLVDLPRSGRPCKVHTSETF